MHKAWLVLAAVGLGVCAGFRSSATDLVVAAPQGQSASATAGLQQYTISSDFVAGVSSGGYMATQLHVAYSGTFKGAAIFSAGPYYCAQGSLTQATLACTNSLQSDQLSTLERDASTWSSQGLIDPVGNLARQPVWVFHGTNDSTVQASLTNDLVSFYQHFGASVAYNQSTSAGHAWISPAGPNPCNVTRSPYVNNCGTDPELDFLGALFGTAVRAPNSGKLTGQLIQFDQNTYAPQGQANSVSMASTGYVYVPSACAGGSRCRLLVALHGCLQSTSNIQLTFINDANLNPWADTNNFVVLYPQAAPTSQSNPNACWDWWGYLGSGDANYAQHGGKQLETIVRIVRALGG
jgi:poly(3-hydroxybutyrate) depolymerase